MATNIVVLIFCLILGYAWLGSEVTPSLGVEWESHGSICNVTSNWVSHMEGKLLKPCTLSTAPAIIMKTLDSNYLLSL